jgi:hypothetical protein
VKGLPRMKMEKEEVVGDEKVMSMKQAPSKAEVLSNSAT